MLPLDTDPHSNTLQTNEILLHSKLVILNINQKRTKVQQNRRWEN